MNTALSKRPIGPSPDKTAYKVIVAPTRDGWRFVVQMRRSARHAWADFPPYRTFDTRAQAEDYVEELER